MSNLYKYYQLVGGSEYWTPTQASLPLDKLKPTFVTILAVDTLFEDDTPKDVEAKAKYLGPMYFDLDAEDIEDAISGAQDLVKKLKDLDLEESDLQVYLSGKKGLHIIVPEACFMPKAIPTLGLPAIYKEIAFKLAVDSLDFRVYTGRKGRQFRTTFNVRENGSYKVPITLGELDSLTAESYAQLCKAPRFVPQGTPAWRGKFALVYDAACQKIGKIKPRTSKPLSAEALRDQLPTFKAAASGENPANVGFNVLAIQLSLYAREAGWDEGTFIGACQGVIDNHQSDGSRYNSPRRRERELRRMFHYVFDNPVYDYSLGGLKSCVKSAPKVDLNEPGADGDEEEGETQGDFASVYAGPKSYMVSKGEDGDARITNFLFRKVTVFRSLKDNNILSMEGFAKLIGKRTPSKVLMTPQMFTGGSGFQNLVGNFGGAFSGSDVQARGIYQAMLREAANDTYVLDSEGVNVFDFGLLGEEKQTYVVWADRYAVQGSQKLEDSGMSLSFLGYPDPAGVFRTDLTSAPTLEMFAENLGIDEFAAQIKALLHSHTAEVMGKMLGWCVAAFYAPLFHHSRNEFPLLHIYGPAGNGKTSTLRSLLQLFYWQNQPIETSPSSTVFALQALMNGSSSIPILLDEYKPAEIGKEKLAAFRSTLREAFNAKTVQRGGGNKGTSNFNALGTIKLSAPLAYVAEAPETEPAIVERSVNVSFKRLSGREAAECFRSSVKFQSNPKILASIGKHIAGELVETGDLKESLKSFEKTWAWAQETFLAGPDDWDKVQRGEMTQEKMQSRAAMRARIVFGCTVSMFGLQVFRNTLILAVGEAAYNTHFKERIDEMRRGCFFGMDTLATAALPEYLKVLNSLSDMTKLPDTDRWKLVAGKDYEIIERDGFTVLAIAPRQSYAKYRQYMSFCTSQPLYPSGDSFEISMREVPQFSKLGTGTKGLPGTATLEFDYDALVRAGMVSWYK